MVCPQLWGVGVRAFQAAGLLPAPYTLVGLLPLGGDTVLELVVHTSLQVRMSSPSPPLFLPFPSPCFSSPFRVMQCIPPGSILSAVL